MENDLKIHVFLVAMESAVASVVASRVAVVSAVASKFKDPALVSIDGREDIVVIERLSNYKRPIP